MLWQLLESRLMTAALAQRWDCMMKGEVFLRVKHKKLL